MAALDIVEREPHRRKSLLASAASLRQRLREQGWNVGESESQIIPIIVGDADRTMRLATSLRERRVLCSRHPAAVGSRG